MHDKSLVTHVVGFHTRRAAQHVSLDKHEVNNTAPPRENLCRRLSLCGLMQQTSLAFNQHINPLILRKASSLSSHELLNGNITVWWVTELDRLEI